MKKSYLMMAAAAMFAACTQTDMVNETPTKEPKPIEFENGFINKSTRSENSSSNYTLLFSDHHNSFAVWGYKKIEDAPVFNNKLVNVQLGANAGSEIYSYDGLVYWDENGGSYQFYAAAPANHLTWTFVPPTNDEKSNGYFQTSIELDNTNIHNAHGAHLLSLKPDKDGEGNEKKNQDLLIAAPCQPIIGNTVAFEFIHILSRLNVVVSKKPGMAQEVRTFEVSVKNLKMNGTFDEGTPVDNLASGSYARWTPESDSKADFTAIKAEGAEVQAGVERHVIQTLVIPQAAAFQDVPIGGPADPATAAPYLYVEYGIENGTDAGGNKTFEHFKKYYNLAKVFGMTEGELPFNEGWENTLTLTIGPASIDFKAAVATWATSGDYEFSLQ